MALAVAEYIAGQNAIAGTTVTATTTATAAVGTRLTAHFAMPETAGTVSCADTRGNTWTKITDVSNGTRNVIFSAPITTQIEIGDEITVTSPSAAARVVTVLKITDITGGGTLDQSSSAGGTGTAAASGSINTTVAAQALVGSVSYTAAAISAVGAGWTQGSEVSPLGGVTYITPVWRILASTGAHEVTATLDSSDSWCAAIAGFYGSSTQTLTPGSATATWSVPAPTVILKRPMIALRNWWRRSR